MSRPTTQLPMKRIFLIIALLPVLLGGAEPDGQVIAQLRSKAMQGLAGAQLNLGEMYANGYGVTQDYAEAVAWYRKAAEQGYWEAQFKLGLTCLKGEGLPKDEVEGLAWITLAAQTGTVSLIKFREKLEQTLDPEVVSAAQRRSKELLATVKASKKAKAAGK